MANKRVSEAAELTDPTDNDLTYAVDVSETLPENRSKKLKLSTLKAWMGGAFVPRFVEFLGLAGDSKTEVITSAYEGGADFYVSADVQNEPEEEEEEGTKKGTGYASGDTRIKENGHVESNYTFTSRSKNADAAGAPEYEAFLKLRTDTETGLSVAEVLARQTVNGAITETLWSFKPDNLYKNGVVFTGGGAGVTVNNTLTSDSTTEALSAAQGKVLQDKKLAKAEFLEPYIIDLHPEFNTDSGWLPADGIINQVLLSVMNGTDNTDYAPSATYVYTFITKASGGGTETSTTTFSTFVANLKALGTTAQSKAQFKIVLPANVPVPVKLTLKIGAYV